MEYNPNLTGKLIQKERKKMKMTQDKLGKKFGITGKQISKYENGELFPPIGMLLKLCEIFKCEIGYLLGEAQYEDGTKLATAIHESIGLNTDSIKNLQLITGTDRKALAFGYESDKYTRIINSLLSSQSFLQFIECLGELDDCDRKFNSIWDSFIEKYGKEIVDAALECYYGPIDYEHNPDATFPSEEIAEAYVHIDETLSQQHDITYQMKIARYELFEAYEDLINDLYQKP